MKTNIKALITNSAQDTFRRYGFKKTTMDDIARAARKSKSSLYYYFKSKEEVFEAVIEKEANLLREEIRNQIAGEKNATDKLRCYIFIRMNGFKSWANLYNAIKDDFLSTLGFVEKIREGYESIEIENISKILREGVADGEFKNLNIELTTNTLVVAMKGFEIPVLKGENTDLEFEKKINDVINMLFYGICV